MQCTVQCTLEDFTKGDQWLMVFEGKAWTKELLPPLEEDFINNRIEATFGEFFGTLLFITQQNLVNLNGGNVNKCQLLPSVSGLVISTSTFILGKSLFGLSQLSSVDTASNQIGKVS